MKNMTETKILNKKFYYFEMQLNYNYLVRILRNVQSVSNLIFISVSITHNCQIAVIHSDSRHSTVLKIIVKLRLCVVFYKFVKF